MKALKDAAKIERYDIYKVYDMGPRKDIPLLNEWRREKVGEIMGEYHQVINSKLLTNLQREAEGYGIEIQVRK